jgi:hypothetical protein
VRLTSAAWQSTAHRLRRHAQNCHMCVWTGRPIRARGLSSDSFDVSNLSATFFYSGPNKARSTYSPLEYRIIDTCQQPLNALFNDTLKHPSLFWPLRKGTKISDVKSVRWSPEILLGSDSYENPRKNQVGVICFRNTTGSPAQDERRQRRVFFLCVKRDCHQNARNVLHNV